MSDLPEVRNLSVAEPVPAIPAATIILLRDTADGMRVLMLRRNPKTAFAPGALVFPGGKLHDVDRVDGLQQYLDVDSGSGDALNPYRVGAIRETFEETGMLIATLDGKPLEGAQMAELSARHRQDVLKDPWNFLRMLGEEGLRLPLDNLVRVANWVTPNPLPRRFETEFFICRAPARPAAVADGSEILALDWVKPGEIVDEDKSGHRFLMLPTRMVLGKYCCFERVDQALAAANTPVTRVEPEVILVGDRIFLDLPEEAGYGAQRVAREDMAEHLAGMIPDNLVK